MERYVALLRGINLGGKSVIPMADLRSAVAGLGYDDVRTYIQTGNVVFGSPSGDAAALARDIEKVIADELGKTVDVLVRDRAELDAVVAANPYVDRQEDLTKLLVTFLSTRPGAGRRDALVVPAGETGELTLSGREVYLHVPDGYGRTKLSNTFVEKKLGVVATTRNWRSVLKLRDLVAGG